MVSPFFYFWLTTTKFSRFDFYLVKIALKPNFQNFQEFQSQSFVVRNIVHRSAATKFSLGGGDEFVGAQPTYPQYLFFLRFWPHYFENVRCTILIRVKKKVIEIVILISGGTSPADFSIGGTRPRPAFGAHDRTPKQSALLEC